MVVYVGRRKIEVKAPIDHEILEVFEEAKKESTLKNKEIKEMDKKLRKNIESVYKESLKLYEEEGIEALREAGWLTLQEAYDYLRENGINVSFRAFGGSIERGRIPSKKIRNKRYVNVSYLKWLVDIYRNYYPVKMAYEEIKRFDPDISYRAFIGRIEKGSIPSIKLGGRRLIPAKIVQMLVKLAKDYYTIKQAYEKLKKAGIKMKRNSFERRVDRGRIPSLKVGGKRYIPKEAIDKLIDIELERRKK